MTLAEHATALRDALAKLDAGGDPRDAVRALLEAAIAAIENLTFVPERIRLALHFERLFRGSRYVTKRDLEARAARRG